MESAAARAAYQRLNPEGGAAVSVAAAAAVIAGTVAAARAPARAPAGATRPAAPDLLDALVLLHWARGELAALEPELITAARDAGASWQALAPALGVASRQAAERRYLRVRPATAEPSGTTRDGRVRAERDRRAGARAVRAWANDNSADLRQLAGQITALTDLADSAGADIARLHEALGGSDATALPHLLGEAQRHLHGHPALAERVDRVTARAESVRRDARHRRHPTGG